MLLIPLIVALITGFIGGLLARRKNRSGKLWGLLLGLSAFVFVLTGMALPSVSADKARFVQGILFWGSFLIAIVGLAALAWLPYLCPTCKAKLSPKLWKQGTCPGCAARVR